MDTDLHGLILTSSLTCLHLRFIRVYLWLFALATDMAVLTVRYG